MRTKSTKNRGGYEIDIVEDEYTIEYFDRTVVLYKPHTGGFSNRNLATVNWSALGENKPEDARKFAVALTIAIAEAELINSFAKEGR